jgi:hypothetical protein
MANSIIGVLIHGGFGTPARLVIHRRSPENGKPGHHHRPPDEKLKPKSLDPADRSFKDAIALALRHTAKELTWPGQASYEWELTPAHPAYPLPPSLRGGSMFGAFALSLMRAVATESESATSASRDLPSPIYSAALERVAVTAGSDPQTGRFCPVAGIEEKFNALCLLDERQLAVCVVAQAQTFPPTMRVCENRGEPPSGLWAYTPAEGGRQLLFLKAEGPADAFEKLLHAQIRSTIGRLYTLTAGTSLSLFLLTRSLGASALAAVISVLSWWFLSDFYMVPLLGANHWREWMDTSAFILPPALLLMGFLCGARARLERAARKEVQGFPLTLAFDARAVRVSELQRTLRVALQQRTGWIAEFLRWHQDLLAKVKVHTVDAAGLARSGVTFRGLARACWLPLLWLVLIIVPRYTNWMENVAAHTQHLPHRIFAVIAKFERVENHRPVVWEEVLQTTDSGVLTRSTTILNPVGLLTVRGTDFPRVYRRVRAVPEGSPPACILPDSGGRELEGALRGGAFTFRFMQETGEIGLNLKVVLLRRDGRALDTAVIEPRK